MKIIRLTQDNLPLFRGLMALFAEAFDDLEAYDQHKPSDAYAMQLLQKPHIIHLVAVDGTAVVGGLVAYVLEKFEQERAEVYIYDLAVAESHRRQGIATALIKALTSIAKEAGAWVMFVQADYDDPPAIALYESLGIREQVLHFDLPINL